MAAFRWLLHFLLWDALTSSRDVPSRGVSSHVSVGLPVPISGIPLLFHLVLSSRGSSVSTPSGSSSSGPGRSYSGDSSLSSSMSSSIGAASSSSPSLGVD